MEWLWLYAPVSFGVLAAPIVLWRRRVARRRAALAAAPFPKSWEWILEKRVALYRRLPDELKTLLRERVKLFIAEKNFEGCGGLRLTEKMKVVIAATACLMTLGRRRHDYPRLKSVLVYPGAYWAEMDTVIGGERGKSVFEHIGESWGAGVVILAWDEVRLDAATDRADQNVIIHEFAHQLDEEDGREADGVPPLETRAEYAQWDRVFSKEFEILRRDTRRRRYGLIDDYGAESPAEFFAVVSETFFARPIALKSGHPELYDCLKSCYRLDPAEWKDA